MLTVGMKQVSEYGYVVVIRLNGEVKQESEVLGLDNAISRVQELRTFYGVME